MVDGMPGQIEPTDRQIRFKARFRVPWFAANCNGQRPGERKSARSDERAAAPSRLSGAWEQGQFSLRPNASLAANGDPADEFGRRTIWG